MNVAGWKHKEKSSQSTWVHWPHKPHKRQAVTGENGQRGQLKCELAWSKYSRDSDKQRWGWIGAETPQASKQRSSHFSAAFAASLQPCCACGCCRGGWSCRCRCQCQQSQAALPAAVDDSKVPGEHCLAGISCMHGHLAAAARQTEERLASPPASSHLPAHVQAVINRVGGQAVVGLLGGAARCAAAVHALVTAPGWHERVWQVEQSSRLSE